MIDVVSLRPVAPDDRAFLLEVYASSRAEELAVVPWSDAQKRTFLEMQFNAQDMFYRQAYPDASFSVVERDGAPVGRLYEARLPGEIRIVDIALLPEHRGLGIGSRLLADVFARADAQGLVVSLHVEAWNRARHLYERLGFRTVGELGAYERMEREPVS